MIISPIYQISKKSPVNQTILRVHCNYVNNSADNKAKADKTKFCAFK